MTNSKKFIFLPGISPFLVSDYNYWRRSHMTLRVPPSTTTALSRTTPWVRVGVRGGVTPSTPTRLSRPTPRRCTSRYYRRRVAFTSLPKLCHLKRNSLEILFCYNIEYSNLRTKIRNCGMMRISPRFWTETFYTRISARFTALSISGDAWSRSWFLCRLPTPWQTSS